MDDYVISIICDDPQVVRRAIDPALKDGVLTAEVTFTGIATCPDGTGPIEVTVEVGTPMTLSDMTPTGKLAYVLAEEGDAVYIYV